jgi:hypothetical protein
MDTGTGRIIVIEDDEAADKLKKLKELNVSLGKEKGKLVKLKREPKDNCKKCHGRGHIGINIRTNEYVPCDCVFDGNL